MPRVQLCQSRIRWITVDLLTILELVILAKAALWPSTVLATGVLSIVMTATTVTPKIALHAKRGMVKRRMGVVNLVWQNTARTVMTTTPSAHLVVAASPSIPRQRLVLHAMSSIAVRALRQVCVHIVRRATV